MAFATVLRAHLLVGRELGVILLHDGKVDHFFRILIRGACGCDLADGLLFLRGRLLSSSSSAPDGASF